ncbi:ATP synthase subunit g, mitochondrial [Dermacentor silvarum]|uniref:ATP synthase subunit g, mitochondrial n=1 Tax=Dermacentor silvarum TaxID=543639 RepID=UPI00189B9752|nr:ATP synthase subunit g, mitochondrial [Dermacentor silvarum]
MSRAVANLTASLIKNGKPKFETFMKYARVEMVPPSPREFPEVFRGFGQLVSTAKSGAWKNFTVKEATINTLVGMEVIFWFYIGECIGKRSIIGYQV